MTKYHRFWLGLLVLAASGALVATVEHNGTGLAAFGVAFGVSFSMFVADRR